MTKHIIPIPYQSLSRPVQKKLFEKGYTWPNASVTVLDGKVAGICLSEKTITCFTDPLLIAVCLKGGYKLIPHAEMEALLGYSLAKCVYFMPDKDTIYYKDKVYTAVQIDGPDSCCGCDLWLNRLVEGGCNYPGELFICWNRIWKVSPR